MDMENFHHHMYYIKQITYFDPLKPKVMKLTYMGKTSFINNGTTIHFARAILTT
jgi:hypothetical protein